MIYKWHSLPSRFMLWLDQSKHTMIASNTPVPFECVVIHMCPFLLICDSFAGWKHITTILTNLRLIEWWNQRVIGPGGKENCQLVPNQKVVVHLCGVQKSADMWTAFKRTLHWVGGLAWWTSIGTTKLLNVHAHFSELVVLEAMQA